MKYLIFIFLFSLAYASEPKVVVVGHAANFSDLSQSAINPYNKAVSNGLEFAIEQQKSKLKKKGIEIKIENFDYGNREMTAIETAKKLIASPAVAAIGFYESSQALLAAPELQKSQFPLVSPVASATRLFNIGNYVHPMSFSNHDMGATLAVVAAKNLKAKKALVIAAADCAYCSDLANAFEEKAKTLNLSTVRADVLNENPNFDKLDKFVKEASYDVIVVPNYELTSAKIVNHLMKIGVEVPYLGGDGWGNAAGSGFFQIVSNPKFQGYCIAHWHPNLTNKLGKEFLKDWKRRFNEVPTMDSAMAFDSMRRLTMAILAAESLDRNGIQAALESMSSYEGVTGHAVYSTKGASPKKDIALLKANVADKNFVPFKIINLKDL